MRAKSSPPKDSTKIAGEAPCAQIIEELSAVAANQAALVAQLKEKYNADEGLITHKDEEIARLRAQLVDARAEAESSKAYTERLAGEKLSLLAQMKEERMDATQYRTNYVWALKYLEGVKDNHFAALADFRTQVEGLLQK